VFAQQTLASRDYTSTKTTYSTTKPRHFHQTISQAAAATENITREKKYQFAFMLSYVAGGNFCGGYKEARQ
jgi:hypothetical protein